MQKDLNQETTKRPIIILGINQFGKADGNPTITSDRDLPWLQDTATDDVWNLWVHEYRDVVILDAENKRVGLMGLTKSPLSNDENYARLKQMFLDAANK